MKKKAYVMPQMAVIGLEKSHGLLAGSSASQEFELGVYENFEDPDDDYYDAEEAD